jgi:cyclohexa-1,5-dienecarbonyl-CoA hydratase
MPCVNFEKLEKGRLLLLRLNRPKANILDKEMIASLKEILKIHISNETTAIIISHEGQHFSFGASVEEHKAEQAADMLKEFHGLFYFLNDLSIPLIAAVKGQCLGGGMELAGFCDFIFAHPEAVFAQPEINLAVFPPMASIIFNLKAPLLSAEMNICGKNFLVDELKRSGIITGIDDTPEQAAIDFALKHFMAKSASSVRLATKANRWQWENALNNVLPKLEKLYLDQLMKTHDADEGIHSFLEKRKPLWRHE